MTAGNVVVDDQEVVAEREIAAPASVLFDIVADPRMHPAIDGGDTLRGSIRGPERLGPGSRFGMGMRTFGLPYAVPNRVVEFEEARRIAWRHVSPHRWRWEFEPLDDDHTLVRHTYAYGLSPMAGIYQRLGFIDAAREGMPRSLENLERLAAERTAEESGDIAG